MTRASLGRGPNGNLVGNRVGGPADGGSVAGRWRISGGPMGGRRCVGGREADGQVPGRVSGPIGGGVRVPGARACTLHAGMAPGSTAPAPMPRSAASPPARPSGPASPRLPTFRARSLGAPRWGPPPRTSEHPGLPWSPPRDGAQVCGRCARLQDGGALLRGDAGVLTEGRGNPSRLRCV